MDDNRVGPAGLRTPNVGINRERREQLWKDGILALLRVARMGSEIAEDDLDRMIVVGLIQTAIFAQRVT